MVTDSSPGFPDSARHAPLEDDYGEEASADPEQDKRDRSSWAE